MATLVKIKNITKRFNIGTTVTAVDRLSLEIQEGESIAIVGKSGSGKSTLLNLMGGLCQPDEGTVFFQDESIYLLNEKELCHLRRRKIGFVFQFFNLIEELTAYENIIFPNLLDGKKPDKMYIDQIVKALGLEDRLKHYPSELSGGQQQRVAIARALVNRPTLILADEPTGNLDEQCGKEVIQLLKDCEKLFHQTIVIVTHDIDLARQMDRIITLKDGQILSDTQEGDPS